MLFENFAKVSLTKSVNVGIESVQQLCKKIYERIQNLIS